MGYEELKSILLSSDNIVFFGGAGVSTESSIPDFRSSTGLYNTVNHFSHPPEVMLSYSFFIQHPEDFFEFYKKNLIFKNAKPNAAHYSLSMLEKAGKLKAVITQNVDGLHQAAGSTNVLELHGSIHRNYCMECGQHYTLEYILNSDGCIPKCSDCGGIVRPDVILYEEELNMKIVESAIQYIQNADVFIVGGTSLVVYPAAGLVHHYCGNQLILINKTSTPYDQYANLVIHDSIGKVLGSIF